MKRSAPRHPRGPASRCEPLERRLLLFAFSGSAFADHNGDGVVNPGETGLPNVRVFVDRNNDGVWQSATEESDTTDLTGAWSITISSVELNVLYHVRENAPKGYIPTLPAGGVHTYITRIPPRFNDTGIDFGNAAPATFNGTVFEDFSGDGTRQAGEPGAPDHRVFVDYDGDGQFDPTADPSALTDAGGAFAIPGIRPGSFRVDQVLPAGWLATTPAPSPTTIAEGGTYSAAFGAARVGSISGHLYEDANGNGVQDPGEVAPVGSAVYLDLNNSTTRDAGEPLITVPATGEYAFTALAPRTYVVRAQFPTSAYYTTDPPAQKQVLALTSGQSAVADFAAVQSAMVRGSVFNDLDGDGVRDPGEPPLAGVTAYADRNGDGVLDAQVFTFPVPGATLTSRLVVSGLGGRVLDVDVIVTGSAGAATAAVGIAKTGSPGSALLIADVTGSFTDLRLDDQAAQPLPTGAAPATGTFRPRQPLSVFNGIPADGEWAIGNFDPKVSMTVTSWTLVLTVEEPRAVTDATGAYALTAIRPGAFEVRLAPAAGYRQTAPTGARPTALPSGQTVSGVDFEFTSLAAISGRVFNDLDGNGTPGPGEPAIPGATLFLDDNDDGIPNATASHAQFTGGPKPLTDNSTSTFPLTLTGLPGRLVDLDVGLDITHPFDADLDVVLVSPSGTRVRLFADLGGDGDNFTGTVLDDQAGTAIGAAAPPFTGRFRPEQPLSTFDNEDPNGTWTIEVTDDTAGFAGTLGGWSMDVQSGERRATSDAAGNYRFDALPASRYLVREIFPAGMGGTAPAAGFYDVTLAAGAVATGLDFGDRDNVPPTVLSDSFPFALKPHRLDVQFSEDVSASLMAAPALTLVNRTTNLTIPAADLALSLGPGNVATWTYTANGGLLPDGNYRATISGAAVKDAAGNAMTADVTFDFFVLAGDANRDRVVNFDDLVILAKNYNKTGASFALGDFDYSGTVNFDDLLILAKNYNKTLPAPAPPPVAAAGPAAFSTRRVAKPAPAPATVSAVVRPRVPDARRRARLPRSPLALR